MEGSSGIPPNGRPRVGGDEPPPETVKKDSPQPAIPQSGSSSSVEKKSLAKRRTRARDLGPLKIKKPEEIPLTPLQKEACGIFTHFIPTFDNIHPAPVKEGDVVFYPVQLGETKVLAHKLPTVDQHDDFWRLAAKCNTEKIICLANGINYLPDAQSDTNAFISMNTDSKQRSELARPGQQPNFHSNIHHDEHRKQWDSQPATEYTVSVSLPEKPHLIHVLMIPDMEDGKGADPVFLRDMAKEFVNDHTQVHCLGGLGRTGTVIVAAELIRLSNNGELSADNLVDTLCSLIGQGRAQRNNIEFVQKPEQFYSLLKLGGDLLSLSEDKLTEICAQVKS